MVLGLRIVTAVVGIPIIVLLVHFGGWILAAGIGVVATLGVIEMNHMFKIREMVFFPRFSVAWVWLIIVARQLHLSVGLALVVGLMLTSFAALFLGGQAGSFQGALTTTWTSLYLGLLFSYLLPIRALAHGEPRALGVFLIIWLTDSMAFFVGRRYGRTKLLPRISPGKTWAGTIGGIAGGLIGGVGLSSYMHMAGWQAAAFGLAVSVAGQVGDLLESHVKRYNGVKDSGELLPGHGGILDRFDSVLFALPVAYYLLKGLGVT